MFVDNLIQVHATNKLFKLLVSIFVFFIFFRHYMFIYFVAVDFNVFIVEFFFDASGFYTCVEHCFNSFYRDMIKSLSSQLFNLWRFIFFILIDWVQVKFFFFGNFLFVFHRIHEKVYAGSLSNKRQFSFGSSFWRIIWIFCKFAFATTVNNILTEQVFSTCCSCTFFL